jgi:hypothetical protein
MKNLNSIILLVLVAGGLNSCTKSDQVKPKNQNTSKSDTGKTIVSDTSKTFVTDTSTTLVSNMELVGNWNIVADTVSSTNNFIYYGKPADHYIFTKYGNLFINSHFENYVDTAVYTISAENQLKWINSYFSDDGIVVKGPSAVGAFTITTLTAHSLVLTQNEITPEGIRYEMITFKK